MNSKAIPYILLTFLLSCISLSATAQDLTLRTVVVDPGHGGKDAGCVSPDKKSYEKTFVLEICREFAAKVSAEFPDVKVILTRDTDVFVPLGDRAAKATKAEANLFISVHVNSVASRSSAANGFSAFILGPSQKYDTFDFNMDVCKRENSVIYLEEDYSTKYKDLDDSSPESQIMLQLMANAYREQSLSFAETISSRMEKSGVFQKSMGVMPGNFQVLRQASMPAVLLELGFITNPSDLSALRDKSSRSKMVDYMVDAFRDYKKAYDKSVEVPSASPEPVAAAPEQQALSTKPAPEPMVPAVPAKEVKPTPQPKAPVAETTPEPQSQSSEPEEADEVYYGTQILASGRLLFKTDPYFRGLEVKVEKVGTIYKYIAGVSKNEEESIKKYNELKSFFPDSFRVRVDKNGISRF